MSYKQIRTKLLELATINHNNGYVHCVEENLISTVSSADFIEDLKNGNGRELKNKFKALHSSSALCVNFFGYFRQHLDRLAIIQESKFTIGQFEKKLLTGLKGTPPNLDFYLENDNCIIGIESKFLELLTPKQPKFSSSYSDNFLNKFDNKLLEIVNYYRNKNSKSYIDTAQLIKHSIGLLNNKKNKNAILIYIHWKPLNADKFNEYSKHEEELIHFANRMKSISNISFHHLTYFELCDFFAKDNFFKQHIINFKNRYEITI